MWAEALSRARVLGMAPLALTACVKYRYFLRKRSFAEVLAATPRVGPWRGRPVTPEISRAVYLSARLIPGTHCLPQALAMRELMHRYGRPCEVRIGVATNGGFRAHAWATADGAIVHGRSEDRFVTLERV